ncbi:low specificity L-threonine aldolase [Mesorhizobium sp. B2-3-3]|nr:low specificity L-threonine aldolase [Mesorhizobium sp. B2-3-3]
MSDGGPCGAAFRERRNRFRPSHNGTQQGWRLPVSIAGRNQTRRNSGSDRDDGVTGFLSDNTSPPAPALLDRLLKVLGTGGAAYAEDDITTATRARLGEIFECELEFFPILTGTAANALAIAQLSGRFGEVICDRNSHIFVDECGAVEFHSQARLRPVASHQGKIRPEDLPSLADSGDVHHGKPTVLSLSQSTETGLVYRPDEIAFLAGNARAAGMRVHMDGTRFANAFAATGASPADLSWRAGVDVLCLGATKGGAIGAEAVIFFSPGHALEFRRMMKRAGHLGARMWFLSAQISAWLDSDFWLYAARHCNAMAALLDQTLRAGGIQPLYPAEANMVFVEMSVDQSKFLMDSGFPHYLVEQPSGCRAARLVTSHDTQEAEVKALALAIEDCFATQAMVAPQEEVANFLRGSAANE